MNRFCWYLGFFARAVPLLAALPIGGETLLAQSPLFFLVNRDGVHWVQSGNDGYDVIHRRPHASDPRGQGEGAAASAVMPVWEGELKDHFLGHTPRPLGRNARWRIDGGSLWSVSAASSAGAHPEEYGLFRTPIADLFAARKPVDAPAADPPARCWTPAYRGAEDEARLATWQIDRGWRYWCVARICKVLKAAQGNSTSPANFDIWPVAANRCRVAVAFNVASEALPNLPMSGMPSICIFECAFGAQPERDYFFSELTGRMQWAGTWTLIRSGRVPFNEPFWVFETGDGRFCVTASGRIYHLRDVVSSKEFATEDAGMVAGLAAIAFDADRGECHLFRNHQRALLAAELSWSAGPALSSGEDANTVVHSKIADAILNSVIGAR